MTELSELQELKDAFLTDVQLGTIDDALGGSDQKVLIDILATPVFRKACRMVFLEIQLASTQLFGTDLSTPEGVSKATRIQGKVIGMFRVIEGLFELLEESIAEGQDGSEEE